MKRLIITFLILLSLSLFFDNGYSQEKGFSLSQNYPNPFNPSTKIKFDLHKNGVVKLEIYNLLGQNIKTLINEYKSAGSYELYFNAESIPAGIYFYKLTYGEYSEIKRMILLK